MTDFAPDAPMQPAFMGRYAQRPAPGQPPIARGGDVPMWFRHPSLDVNASSQANAGVEAGTPTGLFDAATKMPVFATYGDDGSVLEKFYFDPNTGMKIVTNTGFTPTASAVPVPAGIAYETLADGAVERLDKWSTAGVISYTQFHDGAAYTVVNTDMIALKPMKIQMGEETAVVTGASTSLPNIPTASNSQGEDFPQHAYIHVEAGSDGGTAFGIAYTTDDTVPAESGTAKQFEVSVGQGFALDTNAEIVGCRMVPLSASGVVDTALAIKISVEYNNIGEDKDDI